MNRLVPLLSVTFTVAPAVWPCCASNVAVSTLNSCTAPAGGTKATRRPLAMFGDPSSVNSFLPGPPSAVKSDVPPLSNGRENFRSPWKETPGARRASTNGLPSDSGISEIRFSSITCPFEPLDVSSSGASAVTDTVSCMLPTSRCRSSSRRSPILTSMFSRTSFLNPESSAVTEYVPGAR